MQYNWRIFKEAGLDMPNSVVLITGASTGFGRAAAETLAGRGYTVFASMRHSTGRNTSHRQALESVADRKGWVLHVVDLDVTDDVSVDQAVRQILTQAGSIDVVINNAGLPALGLTEAFTVEQCRRVFDVNFFGVVRVNRAVLPSMRHQRSGLLIHVSSAAGRVAAPALGVYCASKFALEALADAYRFELAPFGIDSVLVEPGFHRTPAFGKVVAPADDARVIDYGSEADYAARIRAVHDAIGASPETPGVDEIVNAFVHLIETPAGQRPFRIVSNAVRPLLDPYNAVAAEIRPAVASLFNVPELLELQHGAPRRAV
jgi:NAD(P)-dependent dehydrogenase (short-subunit alcohol dehydrogenase family)